MMSNPVKLKSTSNFSSKYILSVPSTGLTGNHRFCCGTLSLVASSKVDLALALWNTDHPIPEFLRISLSRPKRKGIRIYNIEVSHFNKLFFIFRTFTYGIGQPIHNGFSPIVILIVTIMFAFLLIVFIAAGIFCGAKRWKNRRSEYMRI